MAAGLNFCEFKFRLLLLKKGYQSFRRINACSSVAYCAQGNSEGKLKKYTKTVTLPRTDFPLLLDSQKKLDRDCFIYEVIYILCYKILV
jgi:hypothetical protein